MIRLQRYMSQCGVAARRQAEELILAGKVKLNGKVITVLGTRMDPARDRLEVDGCLVKPKERGIFLFNKPRGVVTTMKDPEGRKTVAQYLTAPYRSYFPVGRLDAESTGLLILTNDGDLAAKLTHPRYEMERIYEVQVRGALSGASVKKIARGVMLDDGPIQARVQIQKCDGKYTWFEIILTSGRKRIIRRLMKKLGHNVEVLHRISHGPFKLGKVKPGELKKLTQSEYERYRERIMGLP